MSPRPSISFVDGAVRLAVDRSARPGLLLESARPRWIRLSLLGKTLAWARPERHMQGVAVWSSTGPESLGLLPPIRSEERKTRSWPAFFARALLDSDRSPLDAGDWELSPLVPPVRASFDPSRRGELVPEGVHGPYRATGLFEALTAPAALVLRWGSFASRTVVALRAASPEGASRVKAWRKAAREGVLPPALLFWISGLDAYVILDGHDRLLAASLEDVAPSAVALYAFRELPADPLWIRAAAERHARGFAHEARLSDATRDSLNDALVRSQVPYRRFGTPARFARDLPERFATEHPSLDAVSAEVRAIFEQR